MKKIISIVIMLVACITISAQQKQAEIKFDKVTYED